VLVLFLMLEPLFQCHLLQPQNVVLAARLQQARLKLSDDAASDIRGDRESREARAAARKDQLRR
jgi:hypothetical protein